MWLSLSETVMRDPAGAVAGRIFAFRDISAEHELEQMKSDFVSTVSVELRTPLTSIYGFAQTLLREDVDFSDDERRTFLDFIARESEGLTTIVDALLNAARLDKGDLAGDARADRCAWMSCRAWSTPRRRMRTGTGSSPRSTAAPATRTPIRTSCGRCSTSSSRTPSSTRPAAAPSRSRSSAAPMQSRSLSPTRVSASRPRIVDRIFSKFTKVASGPGSGLGLFIARGLVREMGGRMWVESTEGVGARFVFALAPAEDV